MLVKRKKRRVQTTWSQHWLRKYPNLIRDFVPTGPNQLWVSDITYWKVLDHNFYITFITDAYSHKIVGYQIADTLESIESVKALEMALKSLRGKNYDLMHHSDRGVQYCRHAYVKLLQKNKVQISMTQSGDSLENAVAKRINRTINEEFTDEWKLNFFNTKEGKQAVKKFVLFYNSKLPHRSIDWHTPSEAHKIKGRIKRVWKNYFKQKPEGEI